jgi:hypothetical protein
MPYLLLGGLCARAILEAGLEADIAEVDVFDAERPIGNLRDKVVPLDVVVEGAQELVLVGALWERAWEAYVPLDVLHRAWVEVEGCRKRADCV